MTPFNRARIAAMLAANAYLKIRSRLSSFCDCPIHEFAYSLAIQALERILLKNSLFLIGDQEVAFGVIAGIAIGHLCQVIGAKREELCPLSDFRGGHCRTRDL